MSDWPDAFISEREIIHGMGRLPSYMAHGAALAKAFAAHHIPHTRSGFLVIEAEISVPHESWYDPRQCGWHVRPPLPSKENQE